MKEIWKALSGYEGIYEISNYGKVRSLDRYVMRTDGVRNFKKGKLLTHTLNGDGYPIVHLSKDGKSIRICVHILVAREFVANPNNLPEVNHIDFDRKNCRYDNLEWVTHHQNILHTIKAGRHISCDICGSKNPNYRNDTLKNFYATHPEEKAKLSRPGGQNGRAKPVSLIEPCGIVTSHKCMLDCADYMIAQGYVTNGSRAFVANKIGEALKKGTTYKNCQLQ